MSKVLLGVGSNIEREKNIGSGLLALDHLLEGMRVSRIYESVAVGFEGSAFYNLVVVADTELTLSALAGQIKAIEHAHGREPDIPKYSSRKLDIDILSFDQLVGQYDMVILPRSDIARYAYVLKPLAEIVPNSKHPVYNKSYREMWNSFSGGRDTVWLAEHQWDGQRLVKPRASTVAY